MMLKNEINKLNKKEEEVKETLSKNLRPKSSKQKYNIKKLNDILNSIKGIYTNNHSRYSIDKTKFDKNQEKLAKIILSNGNKLSLKFHNFQKVSENNLKIQTMKEKIEQKKKNIIEKETKIKNLTQNNLRIKEAIKQKEDNIEKIKKSIEEYKKLNEELNNKINNIKNQQEASVENNINLDNSRDRDEIVNYILSMMVDLPEQNYPNVDNMTYEELLELEEQIGKVSKGLTEEEIKKLKQEKFIKFKYLEDKCIICQYDFKELENVVVLPCNHCFHFQCINPWLSKQHDCPLCKRNIREDDK